MGDNVALRQHIDELGVTQTELARLINIEIQGLTGRFGSVSERTIHNWLSGATKWPPAKIRIAIGAVFGQSIEGLGFTPPSIACANPPEDTVKRRAFIAAVSGVAAASASGQPTVRTTRVGSSDVERLNVRFADVVASDHRHGGKSSIESQALAMADDALALGDVGSASQRVRSGLYACAAAFTSSAMWAAIDGRRFEAAQNHHGRAASLAAMSGDATISFRIWSHAGSMYRHLGRPADALAANDVARRLSIAHRDPLFASLGHARQAAILGLTGDATAVRHAIDRAQEALGRSDSGARRPVWIMAQYDQAELESLSLAAYLALGDFERAEACAHRSLALLRPHMVRSRAITTTRLACAQLGQGDVEHAPEPPCWCRPTRRSTRASDSCFLASASRCRPSPVRANLLGLGTSTSTTPGGPPRDKPRPHRAAPLPRAVDDPANPARRLRRRAGAAAAPAELPR